MTELLTFNEKLKILSDCNWTCNICGAQNKKSNDNNNDDMHIHHKDKNLENNNKENLIVLCEDCYHKLHPRKFAMFEKKKGKLKIKKLPTVLTNQEVEKIFTSSERVRDVNILKLLYYTGLRVNEAIQLTKEDIYLKEKVVRIRAETTKTRRESFQPIPKPLLDILSFWYKGLEEKEKLIPLTKQRVWQIVKKATKKANIEKNVHPHTFRHTYATHIYEETNDLGKVQELLRHNSIASTGIYKHLSKKLKQKTVDDVFG